MKVTKAILGKHVEITWRDPCRFMAEGDADILAMKGLTAMPRWRDRGIVDDLTEDVLRIIHSKSENSVPQVHGSLIPVDLIEALVVLAPVPEGTP